MATRKRAAKKATSTPASKLKVKSTAMTVIEYRRSEYDTDTYTIKPTPNGVNVEAPCGSDVDMDPELARAVAQAILSIVGE